jgi:hypothetical protein
MVAVMPRAAVGGGVWAAGAAVDEGVGGAVGERRAGSAGGLGMSAEI